MTTLRTALTALNTHRHASPEEVQDALAALSSMVKESDLPKRYLDGVVDSLDDSAKWLDDCILTPDSAVPDLPCAGGHFATIGTGDGKVWMGQR